ncbi:GAF and ANTAR domain-containing protein [Pseudonocardia phyllosphaerae]|uniref:GAF and ANTAR domain-containing protein n=1 Tax=Pseudonocardia phyllosphaerae TaxID=3390502 RepID=UPI00397C020E
MHHTGQARPEPVGHPGTDATEDEWAADRARFAAAGVDEAGPLAHEFADLTAALLGTDSVAEALERIADAARRVVPATDLVSITLCDDDGRFHTPIETGPAASTIDEAQYASGRGPCVDAARADGPAIAVSEDLRTDGRWPEFAAEAARHGYLSVLAASLVQEDLPSRRPGALNVYAAGTDAFTAADRDRLLLLATHASLALRACGAVSAAELQETQLRRAVASRDVIGQAKGILMARRGLTADEAFDVLRRTSQDLNVKLVELAGTLSANPTALDRTD